MNLSFQNRIAFYYMIATAIMMAVVFGSIFFLVKGTVIRNLDNDLSYEAEKHTSEIKIFGDSILFINKEEWEEREHREIQVNPVFIQLINKNGSVMDKSPNLKQDHLPFNESEFGGHFNASLSGRSIRQVQLPIERDGKIQGYILAAMSSESALSVILKLRNVLFASYFIILIGLYFVSRALAGRSIVPVQEMTQTIARITKHNLGERVSLPQHQDELYQLSSSFNALLERIEKSIDKEKQFTSDASHELRTPLASLRGTLEVLIRKPREQQEYEDKIHFSLKEIDRMSETVEQLLMLARFDSSINGKEEEMIPLSTLVDASISKFKNLIAEKNLKLNLELNEIEKASVPQYCSNIIIDNILNNAIKYSHKDGIIRIQLELANGRPSCTISDVGIGIREEDLARIYDSFFRSEALNHKGIAGNGLGLAIAKKCADAIHAELNVHSTLDKGTSVSILF